jgi:hypothetical protein
MPKRAAFEILFAGEAWEPSCCAAIVNIADEDDLDSLLLAHSARFQKLLAQADAGISRKGGVPIAEIKRRLAAIKPE